MRMIRNKYFVPLAFLSSVFFGGCGNDTPLFDIVPEISFVSISPATVTEGESDAVKLTIHFQDGDGDLGVQSGADTIPNLIIRDMRANVPESLATFSYIIPNLSPDTRKPSIQGNIEVTMSAPYLSKRFIPPYVGPSTETVSFDVYLTDRAGHSSNHILTSPLTVKE